MNEGVPEQPPVTALRQGRRTESRAAAWCRIVAAGRHGGCRGERPWLIVRPVPGAVLARQCSAVVDGHQAHVLVRLDRLPGGAAAVARAVQGFAGERFSQ